MMSLVSLLLSGVQQAPVPHSNWYFDDGCCGFGMVVAAAGDVDKDGCPDLVIGDPGFPREKIAPTFFIVSGKSGGVLRRITLPASDSCTYLAEGGQDIDADGVPDLLIGAWLHAGIEVEKAVHLISGANGETLRTIPARLSGNSRGVWTRFVQDVDSDGVADVAMLTCGSTSESRILIVHSSRTGKPLSSITIDAKVGDGSCGIVETGSAPDKSPNYVVLLDAGSKLHSCAMGFSRATKQQLWRTDARESGTGTFGVLASLETDTGATRVALGFNDCVDVLDGRTGELVHRFRPEGKTDSEMGFGWALASLGDIDADGFADLAIAETESGFTEGVIYARSGKTGRVLWSARDRVAEDTYRMGYQLAALGDVDGDGATDLVAGTWGCKGRAPGRAFVLSGKTGTILREFRRKADTVIVHRVSSPASAR